VGGNQKHTRAALWLWLERALLGRFARALYKSTARKYITYTVTNLFRMCQLVLALTRYGVCLVWGLTLNPAEKYLELCHVHSVISMFDPFGLIPLKTILRRGTHTHILCELMVVAINAAVVLRVQKARPPRQTPHTQWRGFQ